MAKCSSCEAEIIWAETGSGKHMPLDAVPSDKGNMVFVKGKTWVATEMDRRLYRELHASHFSTCPNAAHHRRRR